MSSFNLKQEMEMTRYTTTRIFAIAALITVTASCEKGFLDVVPDNVATIDNAFANRQEAEKFLFTCYNYMPQEGHPETNPAMNTGDEFWVYWPITSGDAWSLEPYNIARGLQNKVNPQLN